MARSLPPLLEHVATFFALCFAHSSSIVLVNTSTDFVRAYYQIYSDNSAQNDANTPQIQLEHDVPDKIIANLQRFGLSFGSVRVFSSVHCYGMQDMRLATAELSQKFTRVVRPAASELPWMVLHWRPSRSKQQAATLEAARQMTVQR